MAEEADLRLRHHHHREQERKAVMGSENTGSLLRPLLGTGKLELLLFLHWPRKIMTKPKINETEKYTLPN